MEDAGVKTCSKCLESKAHSQFYFTWNKRTLMGTCKVCHCARTMDWAKQNKAQASKISAKWRKANGPLKSKLASEYAKRYPEKVAAINGKRRASKRNAKASWANDFYMKEIYDLAKKRTLATGIQWDVDHIVPLTSPIVCGLHCEANLQVIPQRANRIKSNLYWPDMP